MGGAIGLKSSVGVGSTFWFEIPLLFAAPADKLTSSGPLQGLALVVAEDIELHVQQMVSVAFREFRIASESSIENTLDALHMEQCPVSAIFFCGDMNRAYALFSRLSQDRRNNSTALIYVTGAYTPANTASLLEIEGVSLVNRHASPRHLHNAVHAATSKGGGLGQVIELRTVLEEQRQSLNILVAEDNVTNQEIVKQLLEKAGHTVMLAGDGEAALDLYESGQPDLAILDFNMPERNGLEVTKAIRAMEAAGARLPIMILSASVTADARERARKAGADEFVGKPYDASNLLQTLDRMSRRARNAERNASHQTAVAERTGDIHDLRVANAPLLDEARINEIRRIAGDSAFLSRLVMGFQNDLTRLLESLSENLTSLHLSQIPDITHAIKGAALGIGAARLAAISIELEDHAIAGRQEASQMALVRLQRCFTETSVILEAHIKHASKAASH
jgi:CheY-like chemotaxis protein/HPt (histidine-containing phosphotransfer) domain-containing protein